MGTLSCVTRRRRFYARIVDQAHSPCGQYFVAADYANVLHVFDLDKSLSPAEPNDQNLGPLFSLDLNNNKDIALYSIASTKDWLLCGDNSGTLSGLAWSELISEKSDSKIAFQLKDKDNKNNEINAIEVGVNEDRAFCATGGDNCVKIFDIDSGQLIQKLCGHTDMVHDLAVKNENEILSVSEDGLMIFWDLRTGEKEFSLNPSETECARPEMGKWLATCSLDGDWMIVAGSSKGKVHEWNFGGKLLTEIDVSPACVYSIVQNMNNEDFGVTCVSGSSPKIDVMVDSGYVSFSLDAYPISS